MLLLLLRIERKAAGAGEQAHRISCGREREDVPPRGSVRREHPGNQSCADHAAITTAIQTQGCFNLIHLETMTKVDVFVRWRDPFGQSQFARRQKKSVGESAPLELYFASAEDTVLAKLDGYRKGGCVSDRHNKGVSS